MKTGVKRAAALAACAALWGCGPSGSAGTAAPEPASSTTAAGTGRGSTAGPSSNAASNTARPSTSGTSASATSTNAAAAPGGVPPSHDRFVGGVAISPAGDRAAVWCGPSCAEATRRAGSGTVPLHVVDLPSGAVRTVAVTDPMPAGQASSVRFSKKGGLLLYSTGGSPTVARSSDLSEVLPSRSIAVYGAFDLNDSETHLALENAFGFAEAIELSSRKVVSSSRLHDPAASFSGQVAWVAGERVVFSSEGGNPELWGLKGKRIAKLRVDNKDWIEPWLVALPGGDVVVAGSDGTVARFDGKDGKGKLLRKATKDGAADKDLPFVPSGSPRIAMSADGKKVAVGTPASAVGARRATLTVFDMATNKGIDIPADAPGPFNSLALSPDGSRVAFGSSDSAGHQVAREAAVAEKAPSHPVPGGLIIGYSADGVLITEEKGQAVASMDGHEKWRHKSAIEDASVTLTPDSKVVIIADGRLHLVRPSDARTATLTLDTKDGKLTLTPQAPTTPADVTALLGK